MDVLLVRYESTKAPIQKAIPRLLQLLPIIY